MSELKHFRIVGEITKSRILPPMKFDKTISAINRSRAIEKIYTDFGSKHKAKRYQIKIIEVEETGSDVNLEGKVR